MTQAHDQVARELYEKLNFNCGAMLELDDLALIIAALQQVERSVRDDYEKVLADKRRLVRELDVLMNGDGAARQASLCDVVGSFEHWKEKLVAKVRQEERERIEKAVMKSIGGIAASHRWFPIDAVLRAIREGGAVQKPTIDLDERGYL